MLKKIFILVAPFEHLFRIVQHIEVSLLNQRQPFGPRIPYFFIVVEVDSHPLRIVFTGPPLLFSRYPVIISISYLYCSTSRSNRFVR